jgi:WS/DGAT/MGAT family acyltransferase
VQRLSALDAEFLHLEDGVTHMHIAGMCVFDGEPPTEEELQALLASKLHLIPRYRQRIRRVPLEIGRPVWVDDPHFHLPYHVRATALPQPVDDEAVCRLMGRLMSSELDRRRPLWECWIVQGLPGGRWALVCKVHHCMVDGIAGVGLLEALLDIDADVDLAPPEPWSPAPEPSGPVLVADAWAGLVGDVVSKVAEVPAALADPVGTLRTAGETGLGLVRLGLGLLYTPDNALDGVIGPHRVWAHASAGIADVKRIRTELGGTLNDVVLAAVTRGYRDLLLARGEDPTQAMMRTLVPVSVRGNDARGVPDNRVSAILYELPVGIEDPVERLAAVRAGMAEMKASHMPEAGDLVTSMANLMPPAVVGSATRGILRVVERHPQRSMNTVTTNVPGPQFPLYCLGRRMTEYRPFVPIGPGVRVGTAILSYDGRLFFGVTGDFDAVPDVDVVARGIVAGIDELLDLAAD